MGLRCAIGLAYIFVISFTCTLTIEHSRESEGYSVGYLSNCHGSTRRAALKPKTLKNLRLSVLGNGTLQKAKWKSYKYNRMAEMAKHPGLDFNKKTFLYVGGYLDSISWPIGRNLGQIYKEKGYNVWILDTVDYTAKEFPVVVRIVPAVGRHVGEMLANLTSYGLDPKKLELLGFSLGAQTMSFIAKTYRELTGKNISTLIGLDPTGPCFRNLGPDKRLDRSDADFVLSIATNIDGFGMALPVGHVAFYVNGGEYQPAGIWWLPCTTICSHVKSYFYWVAALYNPHKFIGMQCDSVQQARDGNCYEREPRVTNTLDLFVDKSKPGIYYLATHNRYPYFLGEMGLQRQHEVVEKQFRLLNRFPLLAV